MIQLKLIPAVAILALSATGCSLLSAEPDPTRFAILASADELPGAPKPPESAANSLRIGLGPIQLPDYLRRAAIVTRSQGTRLVPSPTESWAEPFDSSLGRVLAIDLQRELGIAQPTIHPWYEPDKPELQVEIAFSRCELDEDGKVVVACQWILRRLDASHATLGRGLRLERPVAHRDGASVARAISELLVELCKSIGVSVRELSPKQE
ncbi:MAG TPA: PqiC family protein [Planctomycetota bacterium]|nr:PqiC family protein [Planctomycetota bacterium]